ncbi:hypothetical protein JCM10599A_49510 [Paraburkholderia kururiensis]|jgi:hypothetical protein
MAADSGQRECGGKQHAKRHAFRGFHGVCLRFVSLVSGTAVRVLSRVYVPDSGKHRFLQALL